MEEVCQRKLNFFLKKTKPFDLFWFMNIILRPEGAPSPTGREGNSAQEIISPLVGKVDLSHSERSGEGAYPKFGYLLFFSNAKLK